MDAVDHILEEVRQAAPEIRKGMEERRGYTEEENSSGEKQLEADIYANKILKDRITSIDGVGEYASEEEDEVTDCGEGLSVALDPLDGSSNIPTNNMVGTIVGIYDGSLPCRGENLLAAFYVLYGPLTTMTVARDGSVTEYVLDDGMRKTREEIRLEGEKLYGFGGNLGWSEKFRQIEDDVSRKLKLRYGGSLVGDFNQVLLEGGVFGYPPKEGYENGKYRIMFEGNPMAFIAEAAGGVSSNGQKTVLEVEVDDLHQRVPFVVGEHDLVDRVEKAIQRDTN